MRDGSIIIASCKSATSYLPHRHSVGLEPLLKRAYVERRELAVVGGGEERRLTFRGLVLAGCIFFFVAFKHVQMLSDRSHQRRAGGAVVCFGLLTEEPNGGRERSIKRGMGLFLGLSTDKNAGKPKSFSSLARSSPGFVIRGFCCAIHHH